jgi:hypothetical protein
MAPIMPLLAARLSLNRHAQILGIVQLLGGRARDGVGGVGRLCFGIEGGAVDGAGVGEEGGVGGGGGGLGVCVRCVSE